jgi:hypothetical protein
MAGRRWRRNPVIEKLTLWAIFSVIVTLAPFFFGFLQSIDQNRAFTFSSILGSGQLLIVSVAASAAALGELITIDVPADQRIIKSLAIGSCTLVVIIASLWFGDISAAIQGKSPPDPRTISSGSIIVYVWALASSAWCLSLATNIKTVKGRESDDTARAFISIVRMMQQEKDK